MLLECRRRHGNLNYFAYFLSFQKKRSRRSNCHVGRSAAAALASLAARSSAAAPISPVGSRRLAAVDLNNVIGPDTSRRAAGAASSPKFS